MRVTCEGVSCELTVDTILAHADCPTCGRPIYADDVVQNNLTAKCSKCDWFGRAAVPPIRKTLVYLDNSILSHMVVAIGKRDRSSPWIALHEELRTAVRRNVICCPGSPLIDDESQLSDRVSRAVRELSRGLSDVRLDDPSMVQEKQLLRAFWRFLDDLPPETENAPPFSHVSDDEPHVWLPFVQFGSLIHDTPPELSQRRESKESLVGEVSEIFAKYVSDGLAPDEIRRKEAGGIASTFRRCGPLWRFLHIARKRSTRTPLGRR
jgi:hypothetical protein